MSLFYKKQEELIYRVYVTDVLMAIANSNGRVSVKDRFYDLLPKHKKKEKTAEEIIADVIKRAGLKIEGNE